jgi:tellurite resistance protein
MPQPLSPEEALIYIMVTMSAVDRDMSDSELEKIGHIVRKMPVFDNYNADNLIQTSKACGAVLRRENGLQEVLDKVREALPPHLVETAYAFAVETAAADGSLQKEELRLLQIFRVGLSVDRLIATAIERGAHARHALLN